MKKSSNLLLSILALTALCTVSSCKKYDDLKIAKTAWDPNLAVPLGHAEFGVYDVLAALDSNDLIIIDPNTGQVALTYSSEIASFDAGSIVDIGSISKSISINTADFSIPVSIAFNGNANSFRTETIDLAPVNGVLINTFHFKSGVLDIHMETSLRHDISITLNFPDLQIAGVPISRTAAITYSGTVPQVLDLSIDLTDAIGDFTLNGTTSNQTTVEATVSVMGTGEPISGAETFDMDISSSNLAFFDVTGDFGQQSVGQSADSVLLRIFENASDGVFELNNPNIDFIIENSFGFPIDINLANLQSINVSTGQHSLLQNYPSTISVNYPTVLGDVAVTNFELNTSNTDNLATIISPTPKYFYYEVDAEANPAGPAVTPNFIKDDSRFTLTAEVNMPLDGLAYGFFVTDTIDFEFDQNPDYIESVMFRMITDNGFPVLLGTQIYALDANNNTLFTVYDNQVNIVEPAPVDANGVVTETIRKVTDADLSDAKINLLSQVKKLAIYGEVSTTNYQSAQYVKFFDYYKIGLKVAMQIQASTQF